MFYICFRHSFHTSYFVEYFHRLEFHCFQHPGHFQEQPANIQKENIFCKVSPQRQVSRWTHTQGTLRQKRETVPPLMRVNDNV